MESTFFLSSSNEHKEKAVIKRETPNLNVQSQSQDLIQNEIKLDNMMLNVCFRIDGLKMDILGDMEITNFRIRCRQLTKNAKVEEAVKAFETFYGKHQYISFFDIPFKSIYRIFRSNSDPTNENADDRMAIFTKTFRFVLIYRLKNDRDSCKQFSNCSDVIVRTVKNIGGCDCIRDYDYVKNGERKSFINLRRYTNPLDWDVELKNCNAHDYWAVDLRASAPMSIEMKR
ncbi:hypothetical protein ACOME3_001618 [Neoechinorhynchus agilis]